MMKWLKLRYLEILHIFLSLTGFSTYYSVGGVISCILDPNSTTRWVIDMSAASHEMIETLDFRSLDRSEDVIFELVWVIKRSILSFPVYITKKKKNVKSVIEPAVLHWTRRLMVFPRNASFGRCYLMSTRHEILSNIDRNAKPNRNSAGCCSGKT